MNYADDWNPTQGQMWYFRIAEITNMIFLREALEEIYGTNNYDMCMRGDMYWINIPVPGLNPPYLPDLLRQRNILEKLPN